MQQNKSYTWFWLLPLDSLRVAWPSNKLDACGMLGWVLLEAAALANQMLSFSWLEHSNLPSALCMFQPSLGQVSRQSNKDTKNKDSVFPGNRFLNTTSIKGRLYLSIGIFFPSWMARIWASCSIAWEGASLLNFKNFCLWSVAFSIALCRKQQLDLLFSHVHTL